MNNLERGLVLVGLQVLPLALGYGLKQYGLAKEEWGRPLSRFVIWFFNSAVCFLAAWILPRETSMLKLPAAALVFGGLLTAVALAMSRLHRTHTPRDRGAYVMGSCISNYGFTLGGFVCLVFLGEVALSMQTVFIFPLVAYIYLLWFPIARYYGQAGGDQEHGGDGGMWRAFTAAFSDITSLPLAGTIAGLALNLAGIQRPHLLSPVNISLVYAGTAVSTFTIGVTLRLGHVGRYWRENLSVAVTKFLLAPAAGYALACLFAASPLQMRVTLILCVVPVGLFTSFASSIFGLNRDLANSLFMVNTAVFLTCVLPLLACYL